MTARMESPSIVLRLGIVFSCATLVLLVSPCFTASVDSHQQNPGADPDRPRYQVNLELDTEHGTYTGSERVTWTNRGDRGTSVIFFHLYPNVRSAQPPPLPQNGNVSEAQLAPDEPRIEILEVRSVTGDLPLYFNLDDQG